MVCILQTRNTSGIFSNLLMYFRFGKLSDILSIVCGLPDIRLLFVRLQKIFFPILISRCFCWFVYLDVSWDKAKEVNVWNDIQM